MAKKERIENTFTLSHRLRCWIIGIMVVLVYGKTLSYDFIDLDDRDLIVENYGYISSLANIPKAFTTHAFYNPTGPKGSNVYYRPMLTLSLMLDAQVSGKNVKFYHFTNILLHIISCLLLFKLLIRLKVNEDLAFLFALLFAVHPILAQAVAWIPGRNDSLLAVFVFAAFIFLVDYFESKRVSKLFFHFLFFALSLFTKESAVAVPLLGILYVQFFSSEGRGKNIFLLFCGYLLLIVPWFFLRKYAMEHTTADLSFSGLGNSLIVNLPLLLQFIQKSFLPFYLCILSVPEDTNYMIGTVLVGAILFFLFRSRKADNKKIIFGFIWFCAFLLPSFLVKILTGFEHRVYLPLFGLLLVISEIDLVKEFTLKNAKATGVGVLLFVVFLVITVNHTAAFSTNYEFWKTATLNSKHSGLARMNYGLALAQNGETEQAISVYKEGLSINPAEPLIHNNLGIVYARKMYEEAEREFKKEVEVNPKFSDGYFNLGILYQQTGRDSLMVAAWQNAVRVNPANTSPLKALQKYYKSKRR